MLDIERAEYLSSLLIRLGELLCLIESLDEPRGAQVYQRYSDCQKIVNSVQDKIDFIKTQTDLIKEERLELTGISWNNLPADERIGVEMQCKGIVV